MADLLDLAPNVAELDDFDLRDWLRRAFEIIPLMEMPEGVRTIVATDFESATIANTCVSPGELRRHLWSRRQQLKDVLDCAKVDPPLLDGCSTITIPAALSNFGPSHALLLPVRKGSRTRAPYPVNDAVMAAYCTLPLLPEVEAQYETIGETGHYVQAKVPVIAKDMGYTAFKAVNEFLILQDVTSLEKYVLPQNEAFGINSDRRKACRDEDEGYYGSREYRQALRKHLYKYCSVEEDLSKAMQRLYSVRQIAEELSIEPSSDIWAFISTTWSAGAGVFYDPRHLWSSPDDAIEESAVEED